MIIKMYHVVSESPSANSLPEHYAVHCFLDDMENSRSDETLIGKLEARQERGCLRADKDLVDWLMVHDEIRALVGGLDYGTCLEERKWRENFTRIARGWSAYQKEKPEQAERTLHAFWRRASGRWEMLARGKTPRL